MASTVEQPFLNPNCASKIQVLLLQKEAKFYRTLYTSQTNNIKTINTYVTDTTVDYKLTNNEANSFEGLFTINECKYAVFIYAK